MEFDRVRSSDLLVLLFKPIKRALQLVNTLLDQILLLLSSLKLVRHLLEFFFQWSYPLMEDLSHLLTGIVCQLLNLLCHQLLPLVDLPTEIGLLPIIQLLLERIALVSQFLDLSSDRSTVIDEMIITEQLVATTTNRYARLRLTC